jgi:hypothetical protein
MMVSGSRLAAELLSSEYEQDYEAQHKGSNNGGSDYDILSTNSVDPWCQGENEDRANDMVGKGDSN